MMFQLLQPRFLQEVEVLNTILSTKAIPMHSSRTCNGIESRLRSWNGQNHAEMICPTNFFRVSFASIRTYMLSLTFRFIYKEAM